MDAIIVPSLSPSPQLNLTSAASRLQWCWWVR